MKEVDIQNYIWDHKENWDELIVEIEFPEKYIFDKTEGDIISITPEKLIYNELIERLKSLYNRLFGLSLWGCEVPLKKEADSSIRVDLLGSIDGCAGITIIELKKSEQTERQSYTELLAYASHLQSLFPTINKDDITYVLIAPMKERIVRESTIYSFLFDEKPVFAFIPKWENDDISTLRLEPWIPEEKDIVHVTQSIFSERNFDVFKITWDKIDTWNAKTGESPTEQMIARMNEISSYASQLMESKGIHGFTYTLQSYPELPFLPNGLVVVGLNPFKVGKDLYLISNGCYPFEIDDIPDSVINMLEIIPELKNRAKEVNEKNEYFYELITTWSDTITKIAFDTCRFVTINDQNTKFEEGWGGMNWKEYQQKIVEDALGFNYSVRATGLIRKLFTEYIAEDYKFIAKYGYEKHPYLSSATTTAYAVDYFCNQIAFRKFIQRLFGDCP